MTHNKLSISNAFLVLDWDFFNFKEIEYNRRINWIQLKRMTVTFMQIVNLLFNYSQFTYERSVKTLPRIVSI